MAAIAASKQLFQFSQSSPLLRLRALTRTTASSPYSTAAASGRFFGAATKPKSSRGKKKKKNRYKPLPEPVRVAVDSGVKRRTRSEREFDEEAVQQYAGEGAPHIPVMPGEVVAVFSSYSLRYFVDCTVGAAGHSSAIIQAHPELQFYVGMDVDPVAQGKAQARLKAISHADLTTHTLLKNFRNIKSVLAGVDEKVLDSGIDGILMDLGMSSMQVNNPKRGFSVLGNGPLDMRMDPMATLKAEDILNVWPDAEVGHILREYGEESNWRYLQNKIVKARPQGGLHTTTELVDLIRGGAHGVRGGRQGWIKTATRVFQALRIAVNDKLNTLEDALYSCFDCLAPKGRLAVISFHSLEDRIVKRAFLNIIDGNKGIEDEDEDEVEEMVYRRDTDELKELWIKQVIHGCEGTILTKRPITPSQEEEKLNGRCRSAKLRVIQKI